MRAIKIGYIQMQTKLLYRCVSLSKSWSQLECASVILPPCFYQARFCTETCSDVAEWCSESKKLMHCCIIRWSLPSSSVLFLQIVILSTLAIALECLLRWDSTAISLVRQPIDAIDALCILLCRGVGRVSTNWCTSDVCRGSLRGNNMGCAL